MELEQRVRRLEKQARWLIVAPLVMLLLVFVMLLLSVGRVGKPLLPWEISTLPREISARAFVLTDSAGHVAAALEVSPGGPVLSMYDSNNRVRLALGVVVGDDGRCGPTIGFFNGIDNPVGYVSIEPFDVLSEP